MAKRDKKQKNKTSTQSRKKNHCSFLNMDPLLKILPPRKGKPTYLKKRKFFAVGLAKFRPGQNERSQPSLRRPRILVLRFLNSLFSSRATSIDNNFNNWSINDHHPPAQKSMSLAPGSTSSACSGASLAIKPISIKAMRAAAILAVFLVEDSVLGV